MQPDHPTHDPLQPSWSSEAWWTTPLDELVADVARRNAAARAGAAGEPVEPELVVVDLTPEPPTVEPEPAPPVEPELVEPPAADEEALSVAGLVRRRERSEDQLCYEVAALLRAAPAYAGLRVDQQYVTRRRGRVDIAVVAGGHPVELIEVKLFAPLAGIGQLLAYQLDYDPPPALTLLVPRGVDHSGLADVCARVGVRLWRYDSARELDGQAPIDSALIDAARRAVPSAAERRAAVRAGIEEARRRRAARAAAEQHAAQVRTEREEARRRRWREQTAAAEARAAAGAARRRQAKLERADRRRERERLDRELADANRP